MSVYLLNIALIFIWAFFLLMCDKEVIFKRDFPLAAAAYASGCVYGSMPNDGLAKNIVCMPDMLLILFVFGHGKSPFLNNGRGRQHFVLSPS